MERNPSISKEQFVIGGYSAGGTISLRYAEYCSTIPDKYPINPKGVFTVDSPIDLFDIWDYFQREMEKDYSEAGVSEAKLISGIMSEEIGIPETNEKRYNELTPFNHKLKAPGNERHLKHIAVRLYHDIQWTVKLFDSK